MHRLHWYPTEGSAVTHAVAAQSLGHVVGVAQLLMSFTWYRKVLLPGHLWGTSAEKSLSLRFACVSHGTVRCDISDTSGEPSSRRSRREPENKGTDAFLVSLLTEWGPKPDTVFIVP